MTESMTADQYKALKKPKVYRKFNNKPRNVDGIFFPSIKEADRYIYLKQLEQVFHIASLKRQVNFHLTVNGYHIADYRADFTYIKDGEYVVEDVKSAFTAKLPVYQMKKKLMLACHGIEIKET